MAAPEQEDRIAKAAVPDARARTAIHLADGRELIYFDDQPRPPRTEVDTRPLGPVSSEPAMRYDPLLGEWVVLAAHRQERTFLPAAEDCPLCPSRPGHPSEIPAADYDVVVFENRFPSLRGTGPPPGDPAGLLAEAPGVGRCEVICFSSTHDTSFSRLPPARLRTVGWALADRTEALSRLPGVEYVLCFENRGEEIGVTLHHPHGQIYGYPFVPPRVRRALDSARAHRERTGGCLSCEVLDGELRDGRRVVASTPGFVAFVPWAPHWPFEVHVLARGHVPDLLALTAAERDELLGLQADVLGRFDRVFPTPMPYISGWMQAPVRSDRDLAHLRLEIFSARRAAGKLKYLAGSEALAGAFINDRIPEQTADILRAAGADHDEG